MLTKITGTKATKEINNYHYSPGLFEILEISQPEHCRQNVRNYRNKFTQTKEYSIETIMLDVNHAGKDRVELNQSCETMTVDELGETVAAPCLFPTRSLTR